MAKRERQDAAQARISFDYDRQRELSFLSWGLLVWLMIGGWLLLRDPLWRLWHEGDITASPTSKAAEWSRLDEKLIQRLERTDQSTVAGLDGLEQAVVAAVQQRRQAGTEGPALAPLVLRPDMHAAARRRAAGRARLAQGQESSAPEYLYAAMWLALRYPDRLIRAAETYQRLIPSAASGPPDIVNEVVGGWMNDLSFAGMLKQPDAVWLGVGAVGSDQRGPLVDVLLIETFVELDQPLPSITRRETRLAFSGRRLSDADVSLYFKGPKDPSFNPLPVQWSGRQFRHEVGWDQGPGVYALRASRGDRLSDPRPLVVK